MKRAFDSIVRTFVLLVCLCNCNSAAPRNIAGTTAAATQPARNGSGQNGAAEALRAAVGDTARHTSAIGSDSTPSGIVRRYYAAIRAHKYLDAYNLWGQNGKASHQSLAQFAAGFANTATVAVAISDSVRIEGAAGSQYATVPVAVDATLRDGSTQHFAGTYTLRRAMVTGASAADRRWHIYSAELHAVH